MQKLIASVILPVYNQYESLLTSLYGFSEQTENKNNFEVIVIDDGSTDKLKDIAEAELREVYSGLNIRMVHYPNSGRAIARNRGILIADSDIIIFCDADRVPRKDFVEKHISMQNNGHKVVTGAAYDYFGKLDYLKPGTINWEMVKRLSKLPLYHKRLEPIFDAEGKTDSKWAWLSFLVGNSSVSKEVLQKITGFSERFTDWGFEHFEFAYRFMKEGYKTSLNLDIQSFHLPHPRAQNFYNDKISSSIELITTIHPEIDNKKLTDFFLSIDSKYDFNKLEDD